MARLAENEEGERLFVEWERGEVKSGECLIRGGWDER